MTPSARRIEAACGIGLPHLWSHAGIWACTLGHTSSMATDPGAALKTLLAVLAARDAKPRAGQVTSDYFGEFA